MTKERVDLELVSPRPIDSAGPRLDEFLPEPPSTQSSSLHFRSDDEYGQDRWLHDPPSTCWSSDRQKGGSSDTHEPGHIGVPDGGHRAWLVVFGGFLNFTFAFGLLNSFGTFQALYATKFNMGTSLVTWIGSVQLFILFFGGILVGPAFDKWGARPLLLAGTFCCLASFVCTSFSRTYYHYLLSQGFLFGIGNSLLFYPATGAISEWFNEKRAFALGIAVSGSSAGGILWPLVLNRLFAMVSEPWVHRIIAFISCPALLLSCFLIKERNGVASHDTAGHETKSSQTSYAKAVLEWRFFFLCLSLFFIYCGMLIPFYYIPMYAEQNRIQPVMANNLLAIGYGGSVLGRVGSGWVADHLGRFTVLFLMTFGTSIITFGWIWMKTLPAMIAFVVIFGLFSGGLVPLGSACVAQTTPDMGHIGLRIGAMMAFCSFGALAGGPISGTIKDRFGEWVGVFGFSSSVTLVGAFMLLGVRVMWEPTMTRTF